MTFDRPLGYLLGLLRELRALPKEVEWVEFKENYADPDEIGEYISALSNSAALCGKATAYLVWGIQNDSHDIVGSSFRPKAVKKGNEELESWLLRLLTPKVHFSFYELDIENKHVVMLEVARAAHNPVRFQGQEFIRVGSNKKKLKDFPEKERELWRIFDQKPFEELLASEHASDDDVLRLLDYSAFFDLLGLSLPENRKGILSRLEDEEMILPCTAGGWNITNLGAILFAKKLREFPLLKRKALRVIQYRGTSRVETLKEQEGGKGYACGFEGLISYINGLLPANEVIEQALRKSVPMFP
ncbi:MAG: RNA-binding domain-containing protein, partial [Pseudomonadota bacterium]